MYKLLISLLFLGGLIVKGYGQTDSDKLKSVSEFIPKNYFVLQLAEGDLNLDEINDVVLVLGKNSEDSLSTMEHPLKRKFLLLAGKADKTCTLTAQNDNVVYYYNYDPNFKDALTDITIKKGTFTVNHYGGFAQRWSRTSTFTYNAAEKNWYLAKDEYSTFDATDVDKTIKTKTLTTKNFGKIPFEAFDIYKGAE